jgi:hypothetical protein
MFIQNKTDHWLFIGAWTHFPWLELFPSTTTSTSVLDLNWSESLEQVKLESLV